MGYIGGLEMITNLVVNDINLEVEYDLDVSAIYFGDLESEYIDIDIKKVMWDTIQTEIDGREVQIIVDILPVIQMMENEESLKIILRDRMEDIE